VASLASVFRVLNEMKSDGVIEDYAIGGAMAVLFYAEPTRT
jgi:Fe2+ or Zn2+ uptake regulation protein